MSFSFGVNFNCARLNRIIDDLEETPLFIAPSTPEVIEASDPSSSLKHVQKIVGLLKSIGGAPDIKKMPIYYQSIFERLFGLETLQSIEDINLPALAISDKDIDSLLGFMLAHESPAIRRWACYVAAAYPSFTGQRINFRRDGKPLIKAISEQPIPVGFELYQTMKLLLHPDQRSLFHYNHQYRPESLSADELQKWIPWILSDASTSLLLTMTSDLMKQEQSLAVGRLVLRIFKMLLDIKGSSASMMIEGMLLHPNLLDVLMLNKDRALSLMQQILSCDRVTAKSRERILALTLSLYISMDELAQKEAAESTLGFLVELLPSLEGTPQSLKERTEEILPRMNAYLTAQTGVSKYRHFLIAMNCRGYRFEQHQTKEDRALWYHDLTQEFMREGSWTKAKKALRACYTLADRASAPLALDLTANFLTRADIAEVHSLLNTLEYERFVKDRKDSLLTFHDTFIERARSSRPIHMLIIQQALLLLIKNADLMTQGEQLSCIIVRDLPLLAAPSNSLLNECRRVTSYTGLQPATKIGLLRMGMERDAPVCMFTDANECMRVITLIEDDATAKQLHERAKALGWVTPLSAPAEQNVMTRRYVSLAVRQNDLKSICDGMSKLVKAGEAENLALIDSTIRYLANRGKWKELEPFLDHRQPSVTLEPEEWKPFFVAHKRTEQYSKWRDRAARSDKMEGALLASFEAVADDRLTLQNFRSFELLQKKFSGEEAKEFRDCVRTIVTNELKRKGAQSNHLKRMLSFLKYPQGLTLAAARYFAEANKYACSFSFLSQVRNSEEASDVWHKVVTQIDPSPDELPKFMAGLATQSVEFEMGVVMRLVRQNLQQTAQSSKAVRNPQEYIKLIQQVFERADQKQKDAFYRSVFIPLMRQLARLNRPEESVLVAELLLGCIERHNCLDNDVVLREELFNLMISVYNREAVDIRTKTLACQKAKSSGLDTFKPFQFALFVLPIDPKRAQFCCDATLDVVETLDKLTHSGRLQDFIELIGATQDPEAYLLALRVLGHRNIGQLLSSDKMRASPLFLYHKICGNMTVLSAILNDAAAKDVLMKAVVEGVHLKKGCKSGCECCSLPSVDKVPRAEKLVDSTFEALRACTKDDLPEVEEFVFSLWELYFKVAFFADPQVIVAQLSRYVYFRIPSDPSIRALHFANCRKLLKLVVERSANADDALKKHPSYATAIAKLCEINVYIAGKQNAKLRPLPGSVNYKQAHLNLLQFLKESKFNYGYHCLGLQRLLSSLMLFERDKDLLATQMHELFRLNYSIHHKFDMLHDLSLKAAERCNETENIRELRMIHYFMYMLKAEYLVLSKQADHKDKKTQETITYCTLALAELQSMLEAVLIDALTDDND